MVFSQDTDLQIFLSQAFLSSTLHPPLSNNSRARLCHELKGKGFIQTCFSGAHRNSENLPPFYIMNIFLWRRCINMILTLCRAGIVPQLSSVFFLPQSFEVYLLKRQ